MLPVLRPWLLPCVLAACNDAVVLTVGGDRPVPSALSSICLGVAGGNGQFGRAYPLESLPQTLRIEPGSADSAFAWVRGDQAGVPVAAASAAVDFSGDVTLTLDRCVKGKSGAPTSRGSAGPPNAHLVASQGAGGAVVVAITDTTAAIIDAKDGALVTADAPAPPGGAIVAAIAIDIDGDCDDDIVVATATVAPTIWRRDGAIFVAAGTIGNAPVAALTAVDVDGDGAVDLVMGAGKSLAVWRNDGSGTFVPAAGAITVPANLTDLAALAAGDLDGDGHPDLVAGQHGGPLTAWLGAAGAFAQAPAIVPPVMLDVARLALVDADGDFDPDLVVAVAGAPLRLYIDRAGLLEDQSFVRLMPAPPVTTAFAIGGWDAGCEPDLVVSGATWSGQPGGAFMREGDAPVASDAVLVDLDDDGALDAVLATTDGVTWLAR